VKSATVKTWVEILATVGYIGKWPIGPGTMGTLAAVPVAWLFAQVGDVFYLAATLVLAALSIWVAESYERLFVTHDSKEIVIDEFVGGLIAFTFLESWTAWVAAFVFFRILDIFKPFPVGWADKKIPGGLGVVADDILAGIITSVAIQVLMAKTQVFTL
jgi:phosphatidylglycerophosphatase A